MHGDTRRGGGHLRSSHDDGGDRRSGSGCWDHRKHGGVFLSIIEHGTRTRAQIEGLAASAFAKEKAKKDSADQQNESTNDTTSHGGGFSGTRPGAY
jgi:hypothetical protein